MALDSRLPQAKTHSSDEGRSMQNPDDYDVEFQAAQELFQFIDKSISESES